jgi:hypothetical protein
VRLPRHPALDGARALLGRLDPLVFALWAAAWTLASALAFYGSMAKQTGGIWSAPLDDVFIHFDYARSTARGYPFQWVEGNGYSSGNTSLTYPFALAIGWGLGFRDLELMRWAAIVAACSTFGMLLVARGFFLRAAEGHAPRHRTTFRVGSYLLPPVLLGVGVLAWSLWSGMEVAFFLGTWALALAAFFALEDAPARRVARASWVLGAAGVLLVTTRPEAATTMLAFGVFAAAAHRGRRLGTLLRVGAPPALALILQSITNRLLTGESSANGAIVKLALNNPFLTREEKLDDYLFNLKYSVLRNVEYHFADAPAWGVILPALAALALAVPQTRRHAALLWTQIAGWLLMVAMNGQVRWQNERYLQPAVAWLLVAAVLGAVGLARRAGRPSAPVVLVLGALAAQGVAVALRPPGTNPTLQLSWLVAALAGLACVALFWTWPARTVLVAAALFLAHRHQEPKMRDQKWFFGRASRNIYDQHVSTGRWLAAQKVRRVLVGDAGAILYASDRPGLDIIGLGGYHELPFARAGVQGLPATLELVERMSPAERPDVFAIYPSWWGVLPLWFASAELGRFAAPGNVICGGYEDVVYQADWHLLGTGELPRSVPWTGLVDAVDVADLVSEKRHGYVFPTPAGGWTDMRILEDPHAPGVDVWDGGRRLSPGRSERFVLRGLRAGKPATLVVRTVAEEPSHVRVRVDGRDVAALDVKPTSGWLEVQATLPAPSVAPEISVELANDGPQDFFDAHVWVTQ